jgi:hypothetical protein
MVQKSGEIQTMLTECGLLNVWNDQDLYVPCLPVIMERITDIEAKNWHGDVANSSKLSMSCLKLCNVNKNTLVI